jgi:hypothetical protein
MRLCIRFRFLDLMGQRQICILYHLVIIRNNNVVVSTTVESRTSLTFE